MGILGMAGILAFAVLPGAAVVLLVRPRAGLVGRIGTALALSPGIGGGVLALLVSAGASWPIAFLVLIALSAAACALALPLLHLPSRAGRTTAGGRPGHVADDRAVVRVAIAAAAASAIVACIFPLTGEWWRVYSDAWIHAPIVRSILEHGLPPQDPWYAGFRLQYAWIYHAVVAASCTISGLDSFSIMVILAVLSLVAFVFCATHLGSRLHGMSGAWPIAFVTLGLNALFFFFLPVIGARALLGHTRGFGELARAFDLSPLSYRTTTTFLHSLGGQDWFLNKFVVATPFSLALAAYTAWIASLWRWVSARAPSPAAAAEAADTGHAELVLAGLLTLASALLHPVVAIALLATTGFLFAAAQARLLRGPGVRRTVSLWSLAVCLGFLPAAPYVASLLGGGGGQAQIPVDLSLAKLTGLFICLLPGLLAGVWAIPLLRRRGEAQRIWLTWFLGMALLAVTIKVPGTGIFFTVDKVSYLVWIPLALATAGWVSRFFAARGRLLRVLLLILLFGPVNGLVLYSRIVDPQGSWKQPWDLPAHRALREMLPPDAILLAPPGDVDTGNFLARDLYHVDKSDALLRGYPAPEMAARAALVNRLYREGRFAAEDSLRLERLGRPVYAVWPDLAGAPWASRTPGARSRLLTTAGTAPAWDGRLPVRRIGDAYAVSPLTVPAGEALPRD